MQTSTVGQSCLKESPSILLCILKKATRGENFFSSRFVTQNLFSPWEVYKNENGYKRFTFQWKILLGVNCPSQPAQTEAYTGNTRVGCSQSSPHTVCEELRNFPAARWTRSHFKASHLDHRWCVYVGCVCGMWMCVKGSGGDKGQEEQESNNPHENNSLIQLLMGSTEFYQDRVLFSNSVCKRGRRERWKDILNGKRCFPTKWLLDLRSGRKARSEGYKTKL